MAIADRDRVQVMNSDIVCQPELVSSADVVVLNNVFQFFLELDKQADMWRFLRSICEAGLQKRKRGRPPGVEPSKLTKILSRHKTELVHHGVVHFPMKQEGQIPVVQMLSERHNSNAIAYWLTEWVRLGASVPNHVVTDDSAALIHACSLPQGNNNDDGGGYGQPRLCVQCFFEESINPDQSNTYNVGIPTNNMVVLTKNNPTNLSNKQIKQDLDMGDTAFFVGDDPRGKEIQDKTVLKLSLEAIQDKMRCDNNTKYLLPFYCTTAPKYLRSIKEQGCSGPVRAQSVTETRSKVTLDLFQHCLCQRNKEQVYTGPVTELPVTEMRNKLTPHLFQSCLCQRYE
uniref:Uncharacterized protein n=1 Tax=Timema poppense TaxID=170557 RepID=A0A7R9CJR5_TIMPO|nr:unnamed protein product [Timema poppensis]